MHVFVFVFVVVEKAVQPSPSPQTHTHAPPHALTSIASTGPSPPPSATKWTVTSILAPRLSDVSRAMLRAEALRRVSDSTWLFFFGGGVEGWVGGWVGGWMDQMGGWVHWVIG